MIADWAVLLEAPDRLFRLPLVEYKWCCFYSPAGAGESIFDGFWELSMDYGLFFYPLAKYPEPWDGIRIPGHFGNRSFRPGHFGLSLFWPIFVLFSLDLINLFRTLGKKTYRAMGVYYHVYKLMV